ncbi:MAG: hypothetical protein IKZ49_02420 [Alphaproteobacteria bacterium]|nr:hypothetical protein [Alphaproteobacteria bacterium]
MKKILFFTIGLCLGFAAYFMFITHKNHTSNDIGFIPFEKPSECLSDISEMRVVAPFSKGIVLATNGIDYNFIVYLIALDDKNKSKTNRGDTIKLNQDECYRKIGTYTYINDMEEYKKLPVLNIMEK